MTSAESAERARLVAGCLIAPQMPYRNGRNCIAEREHRRQDSKERNVLRRPVRLCRNCAALAAFDAAHKGEG